MPRAPALKLKDRELIRLVRQRAEQSLAEQEARIQALQREIHVIKQRKKEIREMTSTRRLADEWGVSHITISRYTS